MLNRQGRPTQAGEASHAEHATFTGNKIVPGILRIISQRSHSAKTCYYYSF